MTTPLKKGATVTLLDAVPPGPYEIIRIGAAGFQCRGCQTTHWWHDRGKTWTSDDLDRVDEAKRKFSEAAAK